MGDTEDLLYTAIVEAAVSDKTAENTFSKVRDFAVGVDYAHFVEHCKTIEQRYKEEFKCSIMPNPYRSAKSVIKNAKKLHLAIFAKGKTELQKEIKAATASVTVNKLTSWQKSWEKCINEYKQLSSTEQIHAAGVIRAEGL